MTPLGERIAALISREGPITVERYWKMALFDPDHGYYATRDPFGRGGDFTTAPEISQMFGELVAAWLLAAWRALGTPRPFVLAEIGPGRATLMVDILRTLRRLDTGCLGAARIALVETSDRLAMLQSERLAPFDLPIRHTKRIEDVEALPLLLVANELFDAVAIRQFVAGADGWRERRVAVRDERLAFVDAAPEPEALPFLARLGSPPDGSVFEASPLRVRIAGTIAERIVRHGGAALMIDYGHAEPGFGDTLQAVRAHAYSDPLAEPGLADITSHVDFAALAARFRHAGASVAPIATQGDFLLALGLRERAAALGRAASKAERETIVAAARRLAGSGDGEMGELFKVLVAASQPLPLPPFPV
ncbi:class I SAM-dependent methyltransferase [Aureimonas leprariae]|uniref:Class I SAM-dependent methyltransferase n=1 Tax=Plantimonas leprariae TaxID=2615207 RepID=A0A7V7PPC5_9HYPH|nr:SAM-dependent methyltransferase [Aureimonas leprariae]KAB0679805.1 class I SAM-dependent methyltransferase [Aureimonas leprariae]